MPRTNLSRTAVHNPGKLFTKLKEHDTALDRAELGMKTLIVAGGNGAGARTATGFKVGDKVAACINLTDATDASASFEATITVANQIQQTATNLSTKNIFVQVIRQS